MSSCRSSIRYLLRLRSLFVKPADLFLNPPGELTDQHRLLFRRLKRELSLLGTGNSMVVQCLAHPTAANPGNRRFWCDARH